jgi:hypothetical protein
MPSVVCNITLRATGAQPRQLAASPPATLSCDWLHEVALTVPAADGRAYGKRTYTLELPGAAKFAVMSLEGRVAGAVTVDLKRKGPFELLGTRIYLDKDAGEVVSGLAEVKLTNSSSVPRTVTIVAGIDFTADNKQAKSVKRSKAKKATSKKSPAKKSTKGSAHKRRPTKSGTRKSG